MNPMSHAALKIQHQTSCCTFKSYKLLLFHTLSYSLISTFRKCQASKSSAFSSTESSIIPTPSPLLPLPPKTKTSINLSASSTKSSQIHQITTNATSLTLIPTS